MRKIYLLAGLIFFFSVTISAQKNGTIKGIAFDTITKQPVPAATVTVVQKKDSTLVTFTMADSKGNFELRGIPNGEYRLLVTHVNYHNSNQYFTIDDNNKNVDLGNIAMSDAAKVLSEVVVRNEAPPVTLVGDTVQYNAGSFKTPPNANVEQLLKKLPGVQVDKDGTIKAQGERVNRVLVDGKEFFGNDPKVATKNLPADAVDKVQVYDRQSDQAQLTGFEDGNYEKTINLKLKEDKKKGVFGKIAAGGGTDERYEGKFNVNSFKGARQMSAIGMGNNNNAEGFSFMDILNFTGELRRMMQGSGGGGAVNISISSDDVAGFPMGGNNSGIRTTWGGGLNYNNIIGKKTDLQSNYFYNRLNPKIERETNRQNILSGQPDFYNSKTFSDNLNNNHRLNLNTLFELDSLHSIRLTPSFSYQQTNNRSQSNYKTLSASNSLINDGFSNSASNNEGYNFRNDLIFRKKFNRKGRTLSLTLQTSLNNNKGDGSLYSVNNFYNPVSKDTINQRNSNESDLKSYNARIIYTEPVFKRSLMEFSVGRSNSKSTSEKITHDYNKVNGKYDQVNQQQTNDFENTYGFTTAGWRMRTQKRKYNYSFGVTYQQAELEGKIINDTKDSVIGKTFRNLLPNASFRYYFTRFKTFSLNYSANTNQPTMSQLQPVPDNTNPLYIREGNPDLKQEYTQQLRANLSLLSPYRNRNLFLFLTLQQTQNKIVNYDSVNLATGVRRTRPVNVDGIYNINGSINWSMPVHFLKANMGIGSNIGYNKSKQFINKALNNIRSLSFGPSLRFDFVPTDKLNISLESRFNYYNTKYSLQSLQSTKYFQQEYETGIDWQLPKNFFLSTDFTYTVNTRRAQGFNQQVPIWNASISKQFLRFNRGELKLSAMDLLNENIGISRNTNQGYIEDVRVNTLRRFFMLTFTYSLSKTGLQNMGGPGGMRVIAR